MISRIEKFLGRDLDPALQSSVPTLNEIPADMLDDLRRLPEHMVGTYLKFHLKGDEHPFEDFINEVVRGGREPATWGCKDVLAVVDEVHRNAPTMSVDQIRASLGHIEGERWAMLSVGDPRHANRNQHAPALGEPGVLVRQVPYWKRRYGKGISSVAASASIQRLSEAELVVAFRRWIARRVAWWMSRKPIDLAKATPQQIAEAIDVRMDKVSTDGEIALAALIREAQQPFDPERHVRGYTGPDAWYADPAPRVSITGQAALDLHERLRQEDQERRAAALVAERAAADARGKEPFDLETLERMVDTSTPEGNLAPLDERRAGLEYRYYVNHPRVSTLAEFALLLREQSQW